MGAIVLLFAGISFSLLVHAAEVEPNRIGGIARVIDGDSLVVAGKRIRIFGIDAPEAKQFCRMKDTLFPCGANASDAMRGLVDIVEVSCLQKDIDRYGRIVAICHADGFDIGRNMVHAGWALAYRQYSKKYINVEDHARTGKRGMWRGNFVKPWDWRRGERSAIPGRSWKLRLKITGERDGVLETELVAKGSNVAGSYSDGGTGLWIEGALDRGLQKIMV